MMCHGNLSLSEMAGITLHMLLSDQSNCILEGVSQKNPGAVQVVMLLPDTVEGIGMLGALQDNCLTGTRLWTYWDKVCGNDTNVLHAKARLLAAEDKGEMDRAAQHIKDTRPGRG